MTDSTFSPDLADDQYDDELLRQRAEERKKRFAVAASFDVYLVLTVGALVAIGLMMVWSTTFYWAEPQSALFWQQMRNVGIGALVMGVLAIINYRVWKRLSVPLMGVLIVSLLGLVILPIEPVFGAKRAYFEGAVQPSEIATLVVVIYMANWLSSKQQKIRRLTYGLLPFALLVGSVAGLIMMQPDIDPAVLILITASCMFLLAGADWFQLGIVTVTFLAVGIIAVSQFSYARNRVDNWVELLRDPIDAKVADQAQNVIIAFLQGGIGGVGLGESRQKFQLLQAPHTDSIFAVIGEELGLIGCGLVIGLFVMLLIRGFRIARNAPDLYGSLLAAGITISVVLKAMFNIAVMASMVPFTGVPLPFISFGGSQLISAMAAIGLLLSISRASTQSATPRRKVNETLLVPGWRGAISRVRQGSPE
jgi:cell division protein FtsW